ncbi:pyrroline-5-carboxylate reductase [Aliiglaciecola lipolytica]|uniref:Pyrroline-5-carboxylate reductase n=1 Tax=Aliiglaciecola lipolytica E3 TaxID=1127673 RepID=K6XVE7_9ALTE|nr:pyrroline-5-carboxylate reductase [Aliiglaciecola lipolytica]GAC15651.1 pyrroline-5-carboxylate reductase [Aliiglaciecola lipolytica E3]
MSEKTIAFIGAGNMTRSIISGLINSGYNPNKIIASNPSVGKLDSLRADLNIKTTQNNHQAVKEADVVVLAVKPQLMEGVCQDLASQQALDGKLFVSIAAGINHARLLEMLGGQYDLVRTMPNTPSLLSKGMTGLYAPDSMSSENKKLVEHMMASVGDTLWVTKESDIDIVIATAGSSPAYFFLFLESMQNHAVELGMSKQDSRKLVQQAMLGAAEMVCHNDHLEIGELRAQVTSKGGTTAQAVESFQASDLQSIVAKAMDAAISRAQQMSKQF